MPEPGPLRSSTAPPDLRGAGVHAVETEPGAGGIRVEPPAVVTHLEDDPLGVLVGEGE